MTSDRLVEIEDLVRHAQAGDERAFDRLATALRPRVRRWVLAQVDSADDAEDIVQDVLLKMHRGLREFEHGSRVSTWLFAVTRRATADWHRKRHRRVSLLSARAEPPAVSRQPELPVDQDRLSSEVRTAFRALPGRQREIFDLADLQGIPLNEIAQMLNVNPVTARVHLHRARAAIRAHVLRLLPALVEDLE